MLVQCPGCLSVLKLDQEAQTDSRLVCQSCGRRYRLSQTGPARAPEPVPDDVSPEWAGPPAEDEPEAEK